MSARALVFGPFRLDPVAGVLFEGEKVVHLRRRTWGVLCALLARPGEMVSKEELLSSVWDDAVVSEQTLSTSIAELRRALGDDSRTPRFIETLRGRGFRFIAQVTNIVPHPSEAALLGRTRELDLLVRRWREADVGRRRVVFVTGEVGIGKTKLVRAFADRIRDEPVRVAIGQCIEHHGEGEAFMPVIDAVRRLARGDQGKNVAHTIRANAPSWLVNQLGAASDGNRGDRVGPMEEPATRSQTLRCLVEVLEALALDGVLVLLIEDIHWSDASTVDLLNLLGRRRDPARLLVLATLRPADARIAEHPIAEVVQNLWRSRDCDLVELTGLTGDESARLLARQLGGGDISLELVSDLVNRSGGNPFYLEEIATHLLEEHAIEIRNGSWRLRDPKAVATLPEGILATLEPRIARLTQTEQGVLEAAALIGREFTTDFVSEVLEDGSDQDVTEDEVDAVCSRLADRRELVRANLDGGYTFLHALGVAALRRRLHPERRRALHAQIGLRLERSGNATPSRLADHFARAGKASVAASYYQEAIALAKRRFADREVALLCEAALEQLEQLPPDVSHAEREISLQLDLGASRLATRGYSAPEQAVTFGRVCELANELESPVVGIVGRGGLFFHHLSSGNIPAGLDHANQLIAQAKNLPDSMTDAARTAMGVALFNAGELARAVSFLERDQADLLGPTSLGVDLPVFRLAALAKSQAHLGRLDLARTTIDACVARAGSSGRPFDIANGHRMAAEFYAIPDEVDRVRAHAERVISLSESNGFEQLLAIGRLFAGWAIARVGLLPEDTVRGGEAIARSLAALDPTGYRLTHSAFRLRQAEAALCASDLEGSRRAVEAGLVYVEESGERRHHSDLLRLRGQIILGMKTPGSEEAGVASLLEARRIARRQGAVLLEARALVQMLIVRPGIAESTALRGLLDGQEDVLPPQELGIARSLID